MTSIARIQSHVLHVSPKTNWWFLSVTDSSGAMGWGEGSLNGWEPMLDTVCQQWQTDWLGLDLAHAQHQVRAAPASPGGLVGNTVVSAFLQAVLAVQAQHAACAPHTLLGPVQRQAVPLLVADAPLVGTGMEARAALDTGDVLLSGIDGTVSFVDAHRIVIEGKALFKAERRPYAD